MSEPSIASLSDKVDLLVEQISRLTVAVGRLVEKEESSRSYTVVASASSSGLVAPEIHLGSSVSQVGSCTSQDSIYNDLAKEIPAVPDFAIRLCSGLSAGSLTFKQRAERAWESGYWARFVLQGRLVKPRPSRPCDVSNTIYVVLKAEGFECPLLCNKACDYRFILQDFKASTLSHGFGSQAEARVYCLGAGVEFPSRYFQWSQRQ